MASSSRLSASARPFITARCYYSATETAPDYFSSASGLHHQIKASNVSQPSHYSPLPHHSFTTTHTDTPVKVKHPSPVIPLQIDVSKQDSDSDLDSPCWKGTLAVNRSASPPPSSQRHKAGQHLDMLNSLPSTTCGDHFSFALQTSSSIVALPSMEWTTVIPSTVGSSSSEYSNVSLTQCSADVRLPVPHKEDAPSDTTLFNPSHVCDRWISKERLMNESNVAGSMRNESATTGITLPSSTVFNSNSCKVGILDFTEAHGGDTRSSSKPPRLDIQKIVTAMNKLSELLLQNCSTDLDSLNERELHIIERVISNLTHCIRNRIGERTLMPEFSHHYSSCSDKNTIDVNKCSIMELQAPRTKAARVLHDFGYEKQSTFCYSTGDGVSPRY